MHKRTFKPTTNSPLDASKTQTTSLHTLKTLPTKYGAHNKPPSKDKTHMWRPNQPPLNMPLCNIKTPLVWPKWPHPWGNNPKNATLSKNYTREIFDNNFKKLTREKAPGPYNIPNKILKTLPTTFRAGNAISKRTSQDNGNTSKPYYFTITTTLYNSLIIDS